MNPTPPTASSHGCRTATVPYRVPVNVVVDLDTGTVEKVVVFDELVERDDPLGVRDDDWNEIHGP